MTELMQHYLTLSPTERRKIDKLYKSFVAKLPCIVSGCHSVELHHIRKVSLPAPFGAGMGLKPCHIMIIPLSVQMHRGKGGIHDLSKRFEPMHGIDLMAELEKIHKSFMEII